jgi:5'-3' exonuclease
MLFDVIHEIRREIEEFFPYKVVYVDRCEADDIIATLCMEHGTELNTGAEKILILSGDKDFIQLQRFANVDQYNPVLKKWVRHANPQQYITEHILKGDTGDGVPNILSEDNCLAVGNRQKPMTKKRIEMFTNTPEQMDEETKLRYNRNKQMIDLTMIPEEYQKIILDEYNNQEEVGRSQLFNYFVKKKLKNLIGDLQDF